MPEWTRGVRISPLRTIIDALERPQAGELVTSALRPVALGGVRLASGYAEVAPGFGWTAAEQQLVARLSQPVSLEFFFSAAAGVAPERARAILAGLLLLGLAVSIAESPKADGDTSPGLTLTGVVAAGLLREQAGVGAMPVMEPPPSPPASPDSPLLTPAPTWTPLPFRIQAPGAGSPAFPLKRSDPTEARARRQRLLARAMQNMGTGPCPRSPDGASTTPVPGTAGRPGGAAATSPADAALRRALQQIAPRAKEASYFARLGLPETAGRDDVKSAFLALARQFHPDLFGGPAMADLQDKVRDFFSAVNEAYQGLSDDKRRAQHLAALRSGGSTDPQRIESARIDFQKGEACLRTRDHVRGRGFLESAVRADPRPEYQAALAVSYLDVAAGKDLARARALVAAALASPGLGGPGSDRVFHVAGAAGARGRERRRGGTAVQGRGGRQPPQRRCAPGAEGLEGWRSRRRQ